ncbi:hypothetical protein LSH36_477g00039 [Paralvinella palmiformis]|uniref:Uncharacterized protein n=1 Tax=Paralvinella palmiformis TaxID=53620 RepID=A0AAD9J9C4_9ANNE|nr:hypothetical protein LSH36_477g00039 [Paralvinella palmiformis]
MLRWLQHVIRAITSSSSQTPVICTQRHGRQTAYKLYSEYQGAKLSAAQTEVVNEFLVSKNPTFIAELITFQAKSVPYPKAFFTEAALSIDPITWWNAIKPSGVNSDFVDFVLRLRQSPSSSASIE